MKKAFLKTSRIMLVLGLALLATLFGCMQTTEVQNQQKPIPEPEKFAVSFSVDVPEGVEKADFKLTAKVEGAHQNKLETAKAFKDMGLPLEQIAQGTGLSIEEIEAL
ncbi:hypothetical protein FUT79_11405 [Treponema phagedenis]|uniref:hypothetical protein n=1 Tax=Treponema phagedenis TaxID=162 RepID=UPI0011E6558F|nr:hypothetical protein [Treponema phagedenis]QEJ95748.1 hypothetical protein FUT79_11405 [Treponema phagedenis]